MGCITMTDDKTYNPELDIWSDGNGKHFVKNVSNPIAPQWLDVSGDRWSMSYNGQDCYIDWKALTIPEKMLAPMRKILAIKMKTSAPTYLSQTRNSLVDFQKSIQPEWSDFSDISASDMVDIWENLTPGYRLYFREIYRMMAMQNIGGARRDISFEISKWRARNETLSLKDVLSWHETRGSLTGSEEKVLREYLRNSGVGYESDKDCAVRILTWLLLATLKRSSQILMIKKDGLKCVGENEHREWFVEVFPVKYQTGLPAMWWGIPEELANEIVEFSNREKIADLQNKYDRLIVWDTLCLHNHGEVSAADAGSAMTRYIKTRKVVSPRTQKLLHVTPLRLRHTGATRLAFQGLARDIIQDILEHDSPESAQAYIDAVGSEIVPKIEKAGEMRGNIFFELNKRYFQGKVTSDIENKAPVFVPEFTPTPVLVGVCSRDTLRDGVCPKHPFLSCYDGCSCFSAWNNPDPHTQAIKYFEKEIARWEAATGGDKQNPAAHNAIDTYKRAADSAREVLAQIEGECAC